MSVLKVDRPSVMGIADDPADAMIVRSAIAISVATSGCGWSRSAEDAGALESPRSMGCDVAQGSS